jgi:uncharacterized Zn finger protein
MQGRYPRTVREFADNQRHVIVRCGECGQSRNEPCDVLEAMFGPDFDLYDGYPALTAELRCDRCGKKHRLIVFYDSTPRDQFAPVSFEESLNRQLEHRAYVRARGEESTAVRGLPRRRR